MSKITIDFPHSFRGSRFSVRFLISDFVTATHMEISSYLSSNFVSRTPFIYLSG